MTPARWAEIKELYSAAMEMPSAERDAFLDDACPDAGLRQEVRKLLDAQHEPSLRSPLGSMRTALAQPAAIGRYRIVRLLGEGGMGTVYEAEQDQPRRRVAVKAIRFGLASHALLRRFEHEAQALAALHHPCIAQIYEAGTADSGLGPQPFIAMEFIQGVSLVRHAREQRLNERQRLELMAQVCDAVQHAHQRGIIHRDLKPGNILMDETGRPKIVDFGVARDTVADTEAPTRTGFGELIGTLAYMSPEQVLADPLELDTRSDVYALGVILYELLAGRLPYEVGGPLPDAVRTIREKDPARLSSFNRLYRGDIETIVVKALEKEKARRYSSAGELAADIRRYLADEPIAARPSTATYYLRKFARRHGGLVAAVAAALLLLIAGVAASAWEATRARQAETDALRQRDSAAAARKLAQQDRDRAFAAERTASADRDRALKAEQAATAERNRALAEKRRADTESATANAISDFLRHDLLGQATVNYLSASGDRPPPDLKVRTVLDRAAADIAGRFDKQPLVEAAIRHTIGDAYWGLGVLPEARLQAARALELRRRLLGDEHNDTLTSMILLARIHREQGKYADAEPLITRAVEVIRRKRGESHPDTLRAQSDLAWLYRLQNRFAQAESLSIWVWNERRRVLGPDHILTLESAGSLANVYAVEGKYSQAEPLLVQTAEAFRRLRGEDDPDTVVTAQNLANLYEREAKHGLAEPLQTKTLASERRIFGEESLHTLLGMNNLVRIYTDTQRYAEAEALSVKVLELQRRVLGVDHPETLTAMNNLAVLYSFQAKYDLSTPLLEQLLDARRRVSGNEQESTLNVQQNLASAYSGQGKRRDAETLLVEALAVSRRALGEKHFITVNIQAALANVYRNQGRYPEAEALWLHSLEAMRSARGPENPDTLSAMTMLAAVYQGEEKYADSEPILMQALETARRVLGAAHSTTRSASVYLAKVRLEQGKYVEAEALLRSSLNARDNEGPYSWQPFERRGLLGVSLMEQLKLAEAEPLLVASYRGLLERQAVLPAGISVHAAGERIVELYARWGKPDQAAQWHKDVEAAAAATRSGPCIQK